MYSKAETIRYYVLVNNTRNSVYYLTFVAYSMLHLSRKCYANLKVKLERDAGFNPIMMSMMETTFMLFYAFGSFSAGHLGKVYKAPWIITVGLVGSGLSVLLLCMYIWSDLAQTESSSLSILPLGGLTSIYFIYLVYPICPKPIPPLYLSIPIPHLCRDLALSRLDAKHRRACEHCHHE